MNISQKTVTWSLALALLLFLPINYLVLFEPLLQVLNSIAMTIGLTIVFFYGKGLRHIGQIGTAGYLLVLGIVMAWSAIVYRLFWSWLWRLMDQPDWMINHWSQAFPVWVVIIGGILHLTAQNAIENKVPRENWAWVILALVIGTVMGVVVTQY